MILMPSAHTGRERLSYALALIRLVDLGVHAQRLVLVPVLAVVGVRAAPDLVDLATAVRADQPEPPTLREQLHASDPDVAGSDFHVAQTVLLSTSASHSALRFSIRRHSSTIPLSASTSVGPYP